MLYISLRTSLSRNLLVGMWMLVIIQSLLVRFQLLVKSQKKGPTNQTGLNCKAMSGAAATIASDALMNPFDGEESLAHVRLNFKC